LSRRQLSRGKTFNKDKKVLFDFEAETSALKRLSHRHIVELVGSYTDPRWVGLIMLPVADCNLDTYLKAAGDEERSNIRGFYGCLANALLYLHANQIRHKDIKPQNVLIHGTNVLLTDFGISRDWSDLGKSTTIGTIKAFSPKYSSPE
jgi:serine/threonine protein kinase